MSGGGVPGGVRTGFDPETTKAPGPREGHGRGWEPDGLKLPRQPWPVPDQAAGLAAAAFWRNWRRERLREARALGMTPALAALARAEETARRAVLASSVLPAAARATYFFSSVLRRDFTD